MAGYTFICPTPYELNAAAAPVRFGLDSKGLFRPDRTEEPVAAIADDNDHRVRDSIIGSDVSDNQQRTDTRAANDRPPRTKRANRASDPL